MAKVLLVEDDNNLREIYQARLMAEGYDIVAAQNGEEALVVAKQNKPDLIISDVMMPRISGFEMLDILRNTTELKDTKVIMLTALGQAEDQTRADNLGADRYLVKSQVTLEDIVNAAKELLGETTASPETAATADPEPVEAAPSVTVPEPVATVAQQPVQAAPEPAAPSSQAPAVTPAPLESAPSPTVLPAPTDDTVVPASVMPQQDVSVVVPPAPANPTPPSVTVAPIDQPPTDVPEPPQTVAETPQSVALPEPVIALPTPVVQAAPEPATPSSQAPAVTPAPLESAAATAAQPLQAEEADIQAQIDNFANQVGPAPHMVEPTVDSPELSDQDSNDAAIASAVEELNASTMPEAATPQTVTPASAPVVTGQAAPMPPSQAIPPVPTAAPALSTPVPPAPEAPVPSAVSAGGTKVIQPLSTIDTNAPSLQDLLDREEANTITAPSATPAATPQPTQQPPAQAPPVAPAPVPRPDDPSNIAL